MYLRHDGGDVAPKKTETTQSAREKEISLRVELQRWSYKRHEGGRRREGDRLNETNKLSQCATGRTTMCTETLKHPRMQAHARSLVQIVDALSPS